MPERAVVLLVENSEDEVLIVRKAFEKAGVLNPLYAVRDAEGAIAYLTGVGKYSVHDEYPLPALVLMNLNLPGMSGLELLSWIRRTPGINALRVIVFTSLDAIRDVNTAYDLGVNSFVVKETDFENTVKLVRSIRDYWLLLAKTPELSRAEVATPEIQAVNSKPERCN